MLWQLDGNGNIYFLDGQPAVCFSLEIQRGLWGETFFSLRRMGRIMGTRPYRPFPFAIAKHSSKWLLEKKLAATSLLFAVFGPKRKKKKAVGAFGKFYRAICVVKVMAAGRQLTCYVIKLQVFRDHSWLFSEKQREFQRIHRTAWYRNVSCFFQIN